MSEVYENLDLYETPEKIYIVNQLKTEKCLIVDRVTNSIDVSGLTGDVLDLSKRKVIHGLLGVIRLIGGPYLVVVTGREKVGSISGHDIYKLTSHQIISFTRKLTHLNENQLRIEKEYLNMIDTVLSTPNFYFSYTYDLSHTVQNLLKTSPDFLNHPMYLRAEQRFVWNEFLLKELEKDCKNCASFCLPIVHGFVSINSCMLNGKKFAFSLISRRSKERAGCRLFTRGIDANGKVANFVETEQIIETESERASFVQIRGSMPFFWHQYPNLRYKPRPLIIEGENHLAAFNKHFDEIVSEYGRQICVNLIDHKGAEGKLEEFFQKLISESGRADVRYEGFDFHKECKKMRYDRLKILIDRLADDMEMIGMHMSTKSGLVSHQRGVFRTNCIDCLDRTNVVQSMLARENLNTVLSKLGVLKEGQRVENQPGLEAIFKSVWSDNADMVSMQYAGTGALKTDFTRTGKRSKSGVLRDGINSALRYYKNNFQHGQRKDALDLFLGNYSVTPEEGLLVKSPLEYSKDFKFTAFPLILLVAIAMLFANIITPNEYSSGTLLSLLFWFGMVSAVLSVIFYYGTEYVDSPRLVPIPSPVQV